MKRQFDNHVCNYSLHALRWVRRDAGLKLLALSAVLTVAPASARPPNSGLIEINRTTICEIKTEAASGNGKNRFASITAVPVQHEHGAFLRDVGRCDDPGDGTGTLPINVPHGFERQSIAEWYKVTSNEWMEKHVGQEVLGTCVGYLRFENHDVEFLIIACRV